MIFASIDPRETAADAAEAKHKLADAEPGSHTAAWHFLTGDAPNISRLEQSVGISVKELPGRDLYVHPVAVSAITPDGQLSRILWGIDYRPDDLRLALVEASEGRLGSLGDRILLLCSGFDAGTGHYTGAVMLGLRLLSIAMLISIAAAIAVLVRRGSPQ